MSDTLQATFQAPELVATMSDPDAMLLSVALEPISPETAAAFLAARAYIDVVRQDVTDSFERIIRVLERDTDNALGYSYNVEELLATSYTLQSSDFGTMIRTLADEPVTLTLANDDTVLLPLHAIVNVRQSGQGVVTLVPAAGVSVTGTRALVTSGEHDGFALIKRDENAWEILNGFAGVEAGRDADLNAQQDVRLDAIDAQLIADAASEAAALLAAANERLTLSNRIDTAEAAQVTANTESVNRDTALGLRIDGAEAADQARDTASIARDNALGNRIDAAEAETTTQVAASVSRDQALGVRIDGVEADVLTKEPVITKASGFNLALGNSAGTVTEGNDPRLSDARAPSAHDHDERYRTKSQDDARFVQLTGAQSIAGNKTFTGSQINVTGDLTVSGEFRTVSSSEVEIGDAFIVLNAEEDSTPTQDAGIEIERGTSTKAKLYWDETANLWKAGFGSTFLALLRAGEVDAADIATGQFAAARISAASVSQHEAVLTIDKSQISNFGSYATPAQGALADTALQNLTASSILTLSDVDTAAPSDGDILIFNSTSGLFEASPAPSGGSGGTTNHGQLSGLGDDDHPQYHNDARGDVRYYPRADVDAAIAGREPAFTKNAAFNLAFGSGANTVCRGNDARLSDARTPTAHTHTKAEISDFSDADYATDDHNHDADYAAASHDHDAAYAPIAHGHTKSEISDFSDGDYATAAQGALAASALQSVTGQDHGALSGLSDDDHTQYHTDARGDARYYTKAEVDSAVAGAAGTTDHGALTGLGDDDHTQYFNASRGDARYLKLAGGTLSGDITLLKAAPSVNADSTSGNAQFRLADTGATKGVMFWQRAGDYVAMQHGAAESAGNAIMLRSDRTEFTRRLKLLTGASAANPALQFGTGVSMWADSNGLKLHHSDGGLIVDAFQLSGSTRLVLQQDDANGTSEIRLGTNQGQYVALRSHGSQGGDHTIILPQFAGDAGQRLECVSDDALSSTLDWVGEEYDFTSGPQNVGEANLGTTMRLAGAPTLQAIIGNTGRTVTFDNDSSGTITVQAASGVTLRGPTKFDKDRVITAMVTGVDTWLLIGGYD